MSWPSGAAEADLVVEGFERHYGKGSREGGSSVGPLSFSVQHGEFFALLGPSGCGKTTTLRAIAGFEPVDAGVIRAGGREIQLEPPHRRGVGLVFQNHALFPHLTAAGNVGFGLRRLRLAAGEIAARVGAMLELVGLAGFGDRMPSQLSGGQQQRVALARSLVLKPPVLLLDEPLSSLDQKLRLQMRGELRRLQRETGTTMVFVTHDQEEALAMSDRVAVLSQGRIEQIGTPEAVYQRPATRFVANFIGASNLLRGRAAGREGGLVRVVTTSGLTLWSEADPGAGEVTVLIRPERIRPGEAGAVNGFRATVLERTYLGPTVQLRVQVTPGQQLLMQADPASFGVASGTELELCVAPGDVTLIAN